MNASPPATSASRAESVDFSLRQRIVIWLVTLAGFLVIRLICPTLRYEVSSEEGGPESDRQERAIHVFWHRSVFLGTYHYRNRGIAVMTSQSFDGEYIARIIEKFGFSAVRGSSTRGGIRALLGMHKVLDQGRSVAFTVDGPKGPRYVAKPGPVLLARNTGAPIYSFHLTAEKAWVLNSWDRFIIPKPFSRVLLRLGRLIYVPSDAANEELPKYHEQMQVTLDRVRMDAEKFLPGSEA